MANYLDAEERITDMAEFRRELAALTACLTEGWNWPFTPGI